jgi:hypothetical protein
LKRIYASLPEMDSVSVCSRDHAHALGDGAKLRMSQKTPHVVSGIIGPYTTYHSNSEQ